MAKIILLFAFSLFMVQCSKTKPPVEEVAEVKEPEEEIATPVKPKAMATPEEVVKVQDLLNQILENKVFFEFDRAEITADGQKILAQVGDIMKGTEVGKKISVVISGHTDDVGTEEYNLALGEQRARSVMEYLEVYGVEKGRISIKSFGEETPAATGTDNDARAQNRRAEFIAKASIQ